MGEYSIWGILFIIAYAITLLERINSNLKDIKNTLESMSLENSYFKESAASIQARVGDISTVLRQINHNFNGNSGNKELNVIIKSVNGIERKLEHGLRTGFGLKTANMLLENINNKLINVIDKKF